MFFIGRLLKYPILGTFDNFSALRHKNKDEKNNVMQLMTKFFMNSLYREQIRKDTEENFAGKLEAWMMTEYDEIFKKYCKSHMVIFLLQ